MTFHIQDAINFIPSGIMLIIFLVSNKNLKRFKFGSMEYEAKDSAPKGTKNNKDAKQDEVIESIVSKLNKLECFIEKDAVDRKVRQNEVDCRLDKQYEYIREAAMQASVAIVWNDNIPFVERLKAAFLSIKLGANGNLREKLVKIIIQEPNGVVTYKSELSSYLRANEKSITPHFRETIGQIDKKIH